MAMATLTLMFPDEQGIELSITFMLAQDERLRAVVELQSVCLAGQKADFSEWLSESALDLIEGMIQQENDSAYLCRIAVEYEDAA